VCDDSDRLPLRCAQFPIASQYFRPEDAATRVQGTSAGEPCRNPDPAGADHFNIIAPGEPQFAAVEALILKGFK
jgi:hypothetical protein